MLRESFCSPFINPNRTLALSIKGQPLFLSTKSLLLRNKVGTILGLLRRLNHGICLQGRADINRNS